MRPDKKGNKRRDERRNGPKTVPSKTTGPQKSSGSAQKPPAPTQKPPGPAQPPPGAVHGTPVSATPEQRGPRVLEPAAPPPSEAARYRRREIRSNWHRFEEEPGAEPPPPPPDQDFLRGDTFSDLLTASAGAAGHFQLRSERSWLEAAGTSSRLLTLDVHRAAAALSRVPLPDRLGVDHQHFTREELQQFALEADTCAAANTGHPSPAAVPAGLKPEVSAGPTHGVPVGPTPGVPVGPTPGVPVGPTPGVPVGSTPEVSVGPTTEASVRTSLEASIGPTEEVSVVPAPAASEQTASHLPRAAAGGSEPAVGSGPALLQDDWLDSVLSDED